METPQKPLSQNLESLQNKASRFIHYNCSPMPSVSQLKSESNLSLLSARKNLSRLCLFRVTCIKACHNETSCTFHPPSYISQRCDRVVKFQLLPLQTNQHKFPPLSLCIEDWNFLPDTIVTVNDPLLFRSKCTMFFGDVTPCAPVPLVSYM